MDEVRGLLKDDAKPKARPPVKVTK
jgi:hypothetical protein